MRQFKKLWLVLGVALLAATVASFAGSLVLALVGWFRYIFFPSPHFGYPDAVIFFIMSLVAIPFTFAGLLVIGVPLGLLFQKFSDRAGFAVPAGLVGATVGYLSFALIGGVPEAWNPLLNFGLWYGSIAGMTWFFVARSTITPRLKDVADASFESSPS